MSWYYESESEMIAERTRLSSEILGKTVEEAKEMCTVCHIRVICIDGKPILGTKDRRSQRINVRVVDGKIESVGSHG